MISRSVITAITSATIAIADINTNQFIEMHPHQWRPSSSLGKHWNFSTPFWLRCKMNRRPQEALADGPSNLAFQIQRWLLFRAKDNSSGRFGLSTSRRASRRIIPECSGTCLQLPRPQHTGCAHHYLIRIAGCRFGHASLVS